MAKHNPSRIIFTGRNATSAESIVQRAKATTPDANISFVQCDLASLKSVQKAATKILTECSRLDLLLANAGIMAKPPGLTTDGYELQFGTNHLGHALLTQKLLPLLEKTADMPDSDVRIIYTTSAAWRGGSIPFDRLKTTMDGAMMARWIRYCNSKLANMLYARELAHRYPKLLSYSLTPGVVGTSLVSDLSTFDRMFVKVSNLGKILSPEQGTYNHLWAISVPQDAIKPGAYYEPVGKLFETESQQSKDPKLGQQLWDWTEKELEQWMK